MNYKHEEFTPVNDQVIVQPGPVKYLAQKIDVPDEDKNKGKKLEDVKTTKTVVNKIKTSKCIGKILKMDDGGKPRLYKEGDWIVTGVEKIEIDGDVDAQNNAFMAALANQHKERQDKDGRRKEN